MTRASSYRRWTATGALLLVVTVAAAPQAEASCGAVSCFVVIGSQQQVSPAGVLAMNLTYSYTPNELPPGGGTTIPFANQQTRQLILANLPVTQLRALVQMATLDLNYGLTERVGLQVAVPYRIVEAVGQIGAGAASTVTDRGLGDVLGKVKYNVLPTLRSMVVLEMGAYFPTGDYGHHAAPGQLAEATLQVGRGTFGLQPGFYQTYEVVPHRLNQFLSGNWRYNLRNSDGYQFGQEYSVNAGLNLITFPWLTLTGQVNFRYKTRDNIEAQLLELQGPPFKRVVLLDGNIIGRPVPTTNHTYAAYSAGVMVSLGGFGQAYFIAQIPFYQDFNGNLEQATSYVFGLTRSFATPPLFTW